MVGLIGRRRTQWPGLGTEIVIVIVIAAISVVSENWINTFEERVRQWRHQMNWKRETLGIRPR